MFKSQQVSAGIFVAKLPEFKPPDLREKQHGAQLSTLLSGLFGSSCNL